MQKNLPNAYGLYDAPNRSDEPLTVHLSEENLSKQLESGAFVMTREEAVSAGFLSPFDEQDVVRVEVHGGQ